MKIVAAFLAGKPAKKAATASIASLARSDRHGVCGRSPFSMRYACAFQSDVLNPKGQRGSESPLQALRGHDLTISTTSHFIGLTRLSPRLLARFLDVISKGGRNHEIR